MLLFCGSAIYLLFRSKTLNINQWCYAVGLSSFIDLCRNSVQSIRLSDFARFSLPDGLYCAAYILMIDAIWSDDDGICKNLIVLIVPVITICSEILQLMGVAKGTFDVFDLMCYMIPPLTYFIVKYHNNQIYKPQNN